MFFFYMRDDSIECVLLNPYLANAWLHLGNRIWKKGDLIVAKKCLGLALDKVSIKSKFHTKLALLEYFRLCLIFCFLFLCCCYTLLGGSI